MVYKILILFLKLSNMSKICNSYRKYWGKKMLLVLIYYLEQVNINSKLKDLNRIVAILPIL